MHIMYTRMPVSQEVGKMYSVLQKPCHVDSSSSRHLDCRYLFCKLSLFDGVSQQVEYFTMQQVEVVKIHEHIRLTINMAKHGTP